MALIPYLTWISFWKEKIFDSVVYKLAFNQMFPPLLSLGQLPTPADCLHFFIIGCFISFLLILEWTITKILFSYF